jgi:hypothetical protein
VIHDRDVLLGKYAIDFAGWYLRIW